IDLAGAGTAITSAEASGAPGLAGDTDVMLRSLYADATGDGIVNLSDALLIKTNISAPAGPTCACGTPQFDLDHTGGNIDLSDALAAKARIASPPHQALCP